MEVDEPDLLGARPLKPSKASKGQDVDLYGFPAKTDQVADDIPQSEIGSRATANLALREQTITSLEQDYFVTEGTEPASSGFSGGPVLNNEGEVVGMIIRAIGGQTRCIYIETILDAVKLYKSNSTEYSGRG